MKKYIAIVTFTALTALTVYFIVRGENMKQDSFLVYKAFDKPQVLAFLFHPRKDVSIRHSGATVQCFDIPVDNDVTIGARLYKAGEQSCTILFFHGNGEIVSDYDDIGSLFIRLGINFLPVDYRGYGNSTGMPTVESMMRDCHAIFQYVKNMLKEEKLTGPLIVMGRSLGSASALELASKYPGEVDSLIIESGFAYIIPLLRLLGIDTDSLGITEEDSFNNVGKIKQYTGPTLVIHAKLDHIIPFSDGQALYNASQSNEKKFLKIPQANHNTIFVYGLDSYMEAIKELSSRLYK